MIVNIWTEISKQTLNSLHCLPFCLRFLRYFSTEKSPSLKVNIAILETIKIGNVYGKNLHVCHDKHQYETCISLISRHCCI